MQPTERPVPSGANPQPAQHLQQLLPLVRKEKPWSWLESCSSAASAQQQQGFAWTHWEGGVRSPDPGECLQPGRGHINRLFTRVTIPPPASKARQVLPSQRGSTFLLAKKGSRSLGSLTHPPGLPFPLLQLQNCPQSTAPLLEKSPFAEHQHPREGKAQRMMWSAATKAGTIQVSKAALGLRCGLTPAGN